MFIGFLKLQFHLDFKTIEEKLSEKNPNDKNLLVDFGTKFQKNWSTYSKSVTGHFDKGKKNTGLRKDFFNSTTIKTLRDDDSE